MDITTTDAWNELVVTPRPGHLRELFAADPDRATRYTFDAAELRVDASKNLIDDEVLHSNSGKSCRRSARRWRFPTGRRAA